MIRIKYTILTDGWVSVAEGTTIEIATPAQVKPALDKIEAEIAKTFFNLKEDQRVEKMIVDAGLTGLTIPSIKERLAAKAEKRKSTGTPRRLRP